MNIQLKASAFILLQTICIYNVIAQDMDIREWRSHSKKQIEHLDMKFCEDNTLWILNHYNVVNEKYDVNYIPSADYASQTVGIEHNTRYTYKCIDDNVFITFMENKYMQVEYDEYELYMHIPVNIGDTISQIFHARGKYCDRMAFRLYGRTNIEADAYGTLVMPDGTEYQDLLRTKTEKEMSAVFFPIDTLISSKSLPKFTADSVLTHLNTDTAKVKIISYKWYSNAAEPPVLETIITYNSDNILSQTAFLYQPDETVRHNSRSLDKTDNELRYRTNANPKQNTKIDFQNSKPVITYLHGENIINIGYTNSNPYIFSCKLYTIDGIEVDSISCLYPNAGDASAKFNCTSLHRGVYIVCVTINGEQTTEKIILD